METLAIDRVAGSRRTPFNSTGLVRLLAGLMADEVAESKQSFAERLGQWLNWTDAISLSVALKRVEDRPAAPSPADAAAEEFAHVRQALMASIAEPVHVASMDGTADHLAYRRHYVARQRAMETSIGPLRATVRAALAGLSPAASRLAALDAVMDEVLRERERHVLSAVPALLEKHFERLSKAGSAEGSSVYGKDMQAVLLAELELRLQPVEGLLEALRNESTRPQ